MEREKKINLFCGDCIDEMKNIPTNSIDLILCDLPYGTTKCSWDIIIPFELLWEQYTRIIKPKGNIVLFGQGLFAYKLALSNEKLFRYDIIWKKSKCGSPFTAKYMPLKKHENILIFGRPASKYNPIFTEGTPYKRNYTLSKRNSMKYGVKGVLTDNKGVRHPISVVEFPQKWRRQDQVHPTQKPIELLEWLIKTYSDENDTVLDNTMGSGSTGVACVNTNRNFIGIELDKNYFDVAAQRINNAIIEKNNLFKDEN